jgi:hypothetical protein
MNDHAFESLPPAPDDLWPKVAAPNPSVQSQLQSEVFPAPLAEAAGILGRAVHLEMQAAGEYAAKTVMPPPSMRPHEVHLRAAELRFHHRLHTESAARLLRIYSFVHADVVYRGSSSIPTPAQLKAAATRTYRMAVRDELKLEHQIETLRVEKPVFNDQLFGLLKNKSAGTAAKYHR